MQYKRAIQAQRKLLHEAFILLCVSPNTQNILQSIHFALSQSYKSISVCKQEINLGGDLELLAGL